MYVQLNCIIVDADEANRHELASFLAQYGINLAAQLPNCDGIPSLLGRSDSPQLVFVNLDPHPQDNLRKIAHLPRQFPAASFFLMSQVMDANLLMEAMHLGVKEFIPLPISEDRFAAAVERVAALHGMGKRARVINVIPTMGGCGSTTIACNVAASLAAQAKTTLLDLDLIRGGVASYFDAHPRYTIADVMDSADKVDTNLLDNALTVHAHSGLSLLTRPDMPEDSLRVNQPGMHRLLSVLGRMFDNVIVDSMMSIDPLYSTVLRAADLNVLVMQLNIPSVKNAERFIGAMRRMGVEPSKIRLVANRYVKKGCDIEPEEVERTLGLKISWLVPNDFKNAIAAINYGEPVVIRAPKAEMSTSLIGLADALAGKAEAL